MIRLVAIAIPLGLLSALPVPAGDIYRITSTDGKKSMTYELFMGRGRASVRHVAYCPEKKKFVTLSVSVKEPVPKPAAEIWDSRTGETIALYRFPDCPHPLPIISNIRDLRVCPHTGDKNPRIERVGNWD